MAASRDEPREEKKTFFAHKKLKRLIDMKKRKKSKTEKSA